MPNTSGVVYILQMSYIRIVYICINHIVTKEEGGGRAAILIPLALNKTITKSWVLPVVQTQVWGKSERVS